jgi:hypothetical protein
MYVCGSMEQQSSQMLMVFIIRRPKANPRLNVNIPKINAPAPET